MYKVETQTYVDGWVNTWTEEVEGEFSEAYETPQIFETPAEAFAALAEFFDDLMTAGMANQYDPEEYRVVKINT